mgnify:CR=1 FL=1
MGNYHIIGRAGAGSLIAEFLFCEAGIDYDISFPDPAEVKSPDFFVANPLGRIPVLICPDGTQVFETLAIIHHITSRFGDLTPPQGTPQNDRYHQYLALLATSVYPAYHRQHHTRYYGDEAAAETMSLFVELDGSRVEVTHVLGNYLETSAAAVCDHYEIDKEVFVPCPILVV